MIRKRLQLIYKDSDGEIYSKVFDSWKEIHINLFIHGLYEEFQVTNMDGMQLLKYLNNGRGCYELKYTDSVPGSVLFEIVNKHASAKL